MVFCSTLMKFNQYLITVILLLLQGFTDGSKVLELSDRFTNLRSEGQWLVMFYAPWCAHCKRLEPIWSQVAQALHQTNIRVGKLDCTRFSGVASTFKVSAFPTIMFFKEEADFVFKGDRTKEELVNFALRVSGPPVQRITRSESIDHLKSNQDIFFVYVGHSNGSIWDAFVDVAEKHQPYSSFYCADHHLVKNYVSLAITPAIVVFKEKVTYVFDHALDTDIKQSLSRWVSEERFLTFPKITRGNFHQFMEINKYLVLVVLEENKLEELPPDMLEYREMVEGVVHNHRDKYHKHFQFGWIGSPELANSIAMTVLPLPHLIVVNSSTKEHHLPAEDEPSQLTPQALINFLDQVHNQSAPTFGGNSIWIRFYRMYFEGKTTLFDMWQGNPVLTVVIFGLPLGFLSLICYSICCADILDADDDDEEGNLDESHHEKRE